MDVGRAITKAMREQRDRDLLQLMRDRKYRYTVQAWCWWGWAIHRDNHLGYPGRNYPFGWP